MGPEAGDHEEQSSTLKLQLFSIPATNKSVDSPERPGMLTPPLQTSASVPFRWEEEPGKPKPCTTLITLPNSSSKTEFSHKCLELPPRLLLMDHVTATTANNITKLSSPTTVLEGPYVGRSSRFQAPSFRMSSECYGSFRKSLSPDHSRDHDQFGALVLSNSKSNLQKEKGAFGSWKKKGLKSNKKEIGGGSYVFPSSVGRYSKCSKEDEGSTRITRSGSFTSASLARPRFWRSPVVQKWAADCAHEKSTTSHHHPRSGNTQTAASQQAASQQAAPQQAATIALP